MKKYENFKYIFPPRPELKISPDILGKYDCGVYLGQPKLNGSLCEVFMNETETKVFNRHNANFKIFKFDIDEFRNLYQGFGWMCLCGEFMNKAKKDKDGKNSFDQTFVIFDIIIKDGMHLVKTTFEERVKMLDEMYGTKEYDEYLLDVDSPNVFRVKTFYTDFVNLWNNIVKIDMLEGLVLKRKDGLLEDGVREKNTVGSQVKVRKSCRNYSF